MMIGEVVRFAGAEEIVVVQAIGVPSDQPAQLRFESLVPHRGGPPMRNIDRLDILLQIAESPLQFAERRPRECSSNRRTRSRARPSWWRGRVYEILSCEKFEGLASSDHD